MEKSLEQQASNCLKIVLFGPESTGKTTLAKQLADHYKTLWVPEFMREYLQKKWDLHQEKVSKADLLPIAFGQMKTENEAALKCTNLLLCDTNLLEIKVYSEYYYKGFCPPKIKKAALSNNYVLYFLTAIDTVWEADDLRDRPEEREKLFRIFEAELIKNSLLFQTLEGSEPERMKAAIETIDELLMKNKKC